MVTVEEQERKFLVSDIDKKRVWEKEHIIYQWYVNKGKDSHTKKKIIFDLLRARIIYVEITKQTTGIGQAIKNVEYLNIKDFSSRDMVGIPFVLKRRSIRGKLFLDRMIGSNGACDYLLEDEANELENYHDGEFTIVKEVTDDDAYYNQNMCREFTGQDAAHLDYLITAF